MDQINNIYPAQALKTWIIQKIECLIFKASKIIFKEEKYERLCLKNINQEQYRIVCP